MNDRTSQRRELSIRWGELLGEVEPGHRTDLEPSHASEGSLSKDDRSRFRRLAEHKDELADTIAGATDADEVSRA